MDHRAEHDSRYSWGRLGVSLIIATVGNAGMWAAIVVLPAIEAEFGTARADASLPYTATMAGFAAGNLLIGRAVDRWGIAAALAAAALLQGGGFALAAATDSLAVLTALHLVIGFGAAASFAPLIADVSHWFLRRRGIAVGVAASGNYIAGAVWPLVLSDVLAANGWRGSYLALALIVPLAVLPLALLLRRLVSGVLADILGGVRTLLLGSVLQAVALALYLPYDGLVPLYVVSLVFGLSQGGIVPSYAVIVREYLPPEEAGARVGLVIFASIVGMALGGWMSGWIYDLSGSYRLAFLNGIAWNLLNIGLVGAILLMSRPVRPAAA